MKSLKAFTLIEVLIFITILSFIFISIATFTTNYLRNAEVSEHKILATHYAEELLKWLHDQKDEDWNTFLTNYGNRSLCFNASPIAGSTSCSLVLSNLYNRNVGITNAANVQANVYIQVSWKEAGGGITLPLYSIFSIWEQ